MTEREQDKANIKHLFRHGTPAEITLALRAFFRKYDEFKSNGTHPELIKKVAEPVYNRPSLNDLFDGSVELKPLS